MHARTLVSAVLATALGPVICILAEQSTSTQPAAANSNTDQTTQPSNTGNGSTHQEQGLTLRRATQIIAGQIQDSGGKKLGEIADVAVDTNIGKVAFILVSKSDRQYAVPFGALRLASTAAPDQVRLILDNSEAFERARGFSQRQMPGFSDPGWLGRDAQRYGVEPYWRSHREHGESNRAESRGPQEREWQREQRPEQREFNQNWSNREQPGYGNRDEQQRGEITGRGQSFNPSQPGEWQQRGADSQYQERSWQQPQSGSDWRQNRPQAMENWGDQGRAREWRSEEFEGGQQNSTRGNQYPPFDQQNRQSWSGGSQFEQQQRRSPESGERGYAQQGGWQGQNRWPQENRGQAWNERFSEQPQQPRNRTRPTIVRASRMIGYEVSSTRGQELAELDDLMVEMNDGRVLYAVLTLNEDSPQAGKLVALPFEALRVQKEGSQIAVNVPRARLENAPSFDENAWPEMTNPQWARNTYEYYGFEPDAIVVFLTLQGQPVSPATKPSDTLSEKERQYDQLFEAGKVQSFSGTVQGIEKSPPMPGMRKFLIATLHMDNNQTVDVQFAPATWLAARRPSVAIGDQITVRGSKATVGGKQVVIAQELLKGQTHLTLRDEDGQPAWENGIRR